MTRQFELADCRRGAPMGRASYGEVPPDAKVRKMRFTDGCYDDGGAYWGAPADIYFVKGEGYQRFVRAPNKKEAARELLA